jgi:amylosucrase
MPGQISSINPAQLTLNRLLPRLEFRFSSAIATHPEEWERFFQRLKANFPRLFHLLRDLYGTQYDFYYHLEELLASLLKSWLERPATLKALDLERENHPDWFLSNQMLGGVCYVDLFARDLTGIRQSIPYFKELGLTYLHLMPLFRSPEGENDGGYAISSYREVDRSLGTMVDLTNLSEELRQNGISLVVDFVFNHTSNEHEWAKHACAGDLECRDYYLIFPDRAQPDAYERTLREIFPDEHPGAFTYFEEAGGWVWTTFHSYQWDLNYRNPAVFTRMAEEMLSLANAGVEVLRLDAVAFIWKQLGTACENLPEAHAIIQAFNAVARIAAPALIFKSEAIVHPDEVARYIHLDECQVSYNPLLMALLWEALATRKIKLLNYSLSNRFATPPGCGWVNYVRCHDDIGWTFSDEDANHLWIDGFRHRQFLNAFYTGRFPGSFGRGLPFQENPKTGDCRISGTCASLAGLEKALAEETPAEVELAIRRILLIHCIILTIGGVPLIYLGDEIGTLNDYTYRQEPAKAKDSRWVHRPAADQSHYALRNHPETLEGRLFTGLKQLIAIRKDNPVFSGLDTRMIDTGDEHVLGFIRHHQDDRAIILANFSEGTRSLSANLLRVYGQGAAFINLLTEKQIGGDNIELNPYQYFILKMLD